VDDNDDFSLGTAIFYRAPGTLLEIKIPAIPLQHRVAEHRLAQRLNIFLVHDLLQVSLARDLFLLLRCPLPNFSGRHPNGAKTEGRQGRGVQPGKNERPVRGAASLAP
jgi:hypothetical protein